VPGIARISGAQDADSRTKTLAQFQEKLHAGLFGGQDRALRMGPGARTVTIKAADQGSQIRDIEEANEIIGSAGA
jgi:hypothetical protein